MLAVGQIAHADVGTAVGRCAERLVGEVAVGCAEGQTVGNGQFERHLPAVGAREIVGEEQVDGITLVGGHGDAPAVDFHLGAHERQAHPRVGAGHKLAVELQVESCGVSATLLTGIVGDLHVVDGIGHQIVQRLVVGLGRKAVGPLAQLEAVVETGDEMYALLALDFAVERGMCDVVDGEGVAQLLEEGSLVVEACGETQGDIVVECRHDAQRHTRTEDALLVEVPMAEPHAIVERVEGGFISVGKFPGVLDIGFHAVGIELVVGLERIDHVEVLPRVGHAVAAGVAHLIFLGVLSDFLYLVGETRLYVVVLGLVAHGQLHALDGGLEIVACMFHIGAHAEVLVGFGLVEPILPLDVIAFLLVGVECRGDERELGLVVELVGDVERSEEGGEHILLPTVEIHLERLDALHGAKLGFAVFGIEVVAAVRDVADEGDVPPLGGAVGEECLVVEEFGVILAVGVEGGEHTLVGLVAQAVAPAELLVAEAHIGTCPEQTGRCLGLEALGPLVGDVECRRHLVAVDGLETARGEADRLHHVGVDDRQAFLLSAAHQEGAIHLHIVDIHAVLVETSATHVVLRRQFAVARHACLLLYQFFNGITRHAGRVQQVLGIELLCASRLPFLFGHGHFGEQVVVKQLYLQRLLAAWAAQHTGLGLVAHHRKFHHHAVGTLQLHGKLALEIGHGHTTLAEHRNRGQFDGAHVAVGHLALQGESLRRGRNEPQQGYREK